jgi:hypothetical protein
MRRRTSPKGYESFAPYFEGAGTADEINMRRYQIDQNIAARKRRDARGGWSTFGTDAVAGVLDPINLFAPELKGLGFVGGAVKGAATIGAAGAGAEAVRGTLDPTSSRAETVASMLSSVGLGGVLGGVVGHLTHSVSPVTAATTRPVRPVIDVDNAGAKAAIFNHVTVVKESSGGKNLVGTPTFDGKKVVQAMGAAQVTGDTGKAMAEKLGVPWEPERLKSHKPEDIAYQKELGYAYWDEAVRASNGDLETAFKYYYGGPNRKSWGEKTNAYARESMAMLGYGDGAKSVMGSANPVAVMNALQGMERPSHVEVDGRWLPVVDGALPNGGLAARVPAKSAGEILGSSVDSAARAERGGDAGLGRAPEPSIFDGVTKFRLKEIPDVAVSWAQRAHHDEGFAAELGLGRYPDPPEIERAIMDERKSQLMAEAQRKADAGEYNSRPGAAAGGDATDASGQPIDRALLERQKAALQERLSALEARALKDENARVPTGYRRPTGEEIAKGKYTANARIATGFEKITATAKRLTQKVKELQDEIDAAGGSVTPDLAAGEMFASGSPLAAEGDAYARSHLPDHYDSDAIDLRRMDAEKRAQDFDSGELADELPFGMDHDGTNYFESDGEHIRIDTQAIFRSFKDKPWTAPRIAGVTPLPEDAFKDPGEWLDFIVAHEVEHSVNPARAGEDPAAYENRINAQAYEKVQASRAPGGTIDSRLRRLALVGTPLSALERLVKDKDAPIHRSMQLLASDMAVQLAANKLGFTPLKGGSVLQRVERWRVRPLAELQDAVRRGYLEELGLSGEGTRTEVGTRVLAQRGRALVSKLPKFGDGATRKSLAEFKEDVAAAYVGFEGELGGRTVAPSDVAKRVAGKLKELDDGFEKEARSVNLFNKTKELSRLKESAEASARELKKRADTLRGFGKGEAAQEIDDLAAAASARAEDYARKLDEPIMQPGEKQHYHRIYDVKALQEDRDGAISALEQAYRRNHHESPRLAAEAAYDQITLEPSGDIQGPGTAAGLKRLDLPWTNAEAFPYIVRDPELSFGIYARQMGSAIEMTRSFGDAYALDHIDQLRADLAERGVATQKAERAIQLFEDARDHIVGGFHRKDPLAWDYRTARALKNVGNLAVLGKAVYSQVSDLARFIGVQGLGARRLVTGEGPAGLIGSLMSAFAGDISKFHPGGIAKLSGEAGELVTARLSALMMDSDANVLAMRDSAIERSLASAQVPYFMLNLMTPWTIFWKELAGASAAHNIISESKQVAAHIHAGGTIETAAKNVRQMYERLAQHGIDPTVAQLIADMPTETGAGGLHLANVLSWEGERGHEARQALLAAVNGEIRRSVPTPSVLERPRIFDGTFYSAKGREEAQAEIARLRDMLQQTTDPDEAAGIRSQIEAARRDVGRAGRVQMPLLALPFQLHVFAMSAGAKTLYGLMSSSERARFGSIVSLLLAGMTVTYLKAHDPLGGLTTSSHKQRKQAYAWDKMTWGEMAWSSWEYSNLGGIFTDVAKNVTTLARAADVDPSFGAIPNVDPNDHSLRDEVGSSAGVAPALVWGLVEPFVTHDPNNTYADAVRRVVPFNNVIWWKGAVDRVTDALHEPSVATTSMQSPADTAGLSFGRKDGAFFAPDPEAMAPIIKAMQQPATPQLLAPAAYDLSNPPPLRREPKGRRARVMKPQLFGESTTPASAPPPPPPSSQGLPLLRRPRALRSPKRIKPNLF